jgi:hypothetical protein
MRSKMLPVVALAAVVAAFFLASSCGSGSGVVQCPVCGTDKNGSVALLSVMPVPEHNPTGEPGGPFNIFDIGWVDPVNHLYYIADRTGLDVPVFSTTSLVALAAIGGLNSVAEAGNNASTCFDTAKFPDPVGSTIPPITTAQGNYTRFGCRTMNFSLAGGFGPNGTFGGFMGGQCCASRSNNLNPLSGPNGLEANEDGSVLMVGNGSASMVFFDMTQTIADIKANVASPTPPRVLAALPLGTSPDYDGIPNGITGCEQSANGRAFSDPTCGDLRTDEISTGTVNGHFLILAANGDPGLPFVTLIDATNIVNKTGTQQQQHCQPVNPNIPYSPGGPFAAFPQNLPLPAVSGGCILGQIYYDGSPVNDITVTVDDGGPNAGISCPNPSLFFDQANTTPVPSGVSGRNAGGAGVDVPCHRGPFIASFGATAVALAGIGGSVFNPHTNTFWVSNSNASGDITLGTIDEIDPRLGNANGPAVINSFPVIGCMPSGVVVGPGTDMLITCENHDGRTFPPSTIIMDGSATATEGTILATIPFIGGTDEGWFNPGDGKYYLASRDMPTGPVLGVIDAKSRRWLQNVPTNSNSHSVAVDRTNNRVFVPLAAGGVCQTQSGNGCVGVYGSQ